LSEEKTDPAFFFYCQSRHSPPMIATAFKATLSQYF